MIATVLKRYVPGVDISRVVVPRICSGIYSGQNRRENREDTKLEHMGAVMHVRMEHTCIIVHSGYETVHIHLYLLSQKCEKFPSMHTI